MVASETEITPLAHIRRFEALTPRAHAYQTLGYEGMWAVRQKPDLSHPMKHFVVPLDGGDACDEAVRLNVLKHRFGFENIAIKLTPLAPSNLAPALKAGAWMVAKKSDVYMRLPAPWCEKGAPATLERLEGVANLSRYGGVPGFDCARWLAEIKPPVAAVVALSREVGFASFIAMDDGYSKIIAIKEGCTRGNGALEAHFTGVVAALCEEGQTIWLNIDHQDSAMAALLAKLGFGLVYSYDIWQQP